MTILRPVTETVPATITILEDTSLPFSFVLKPYGLSPSLGRDERRKNDKKNTEISNDNSVLSSSPVQVQLPIKASLIAKCTHCGAPNNFCSKFISSSRVLCSLCGMTFGVNYETQYMARSRAASSGRDAASISMSMAGSANDAERKEEEDEYRNRYGRIRTFEECSKPLLEYSLPVCFTKATKREQERAVYSLPANDCSPLLSILIDGSSNCSGYYDNICHSLSMLLKRKSTEFKGTKIGIFVMTKEGGVSVFDLQNAVTHLKHFFLDPPPLKKNLPTRNDNGGNSSNIRSRNHNNMLTFSQVLDIDQIFVPLHSDFSRHCVESALRALADSTLLINQACSRNHNSHQTREEGPGGVFLGSTIQSILQLIEDVGGYHPGMKKPGIDSRSALSTTREFMYAGGKIMCFLAGPTAEIGYFSLNKSEYEGKFGTGGFGGTCAEIGRRFAADKKDIPSEGYSAFYGEQNDPEAPSPNLQLDDDDGDISSEKEQNFEHILPPSPYSNVSDYFQHLGISCAKAAFGVEIFTLLEEGEDENQKNYIGLPVLRLLSDRSGGCGPLLFSISKETPLNKSYKCSLNMEVLARTPWHRPTAFGGILRIRLSPSLSIDKVSIDNKESTGPSQYYKSYGLSGSVSPSPDDDDLLLMGCCETLSTLCFDVSIVSTTGEISNAVYVDGRGDVAIPPCLQTCFAYTGIERVGEEWVIVRRLRVLTNDFELAENAEYLTNSLDAEALSVVLFHKLYYASIEDGLLEAQSVARDWLLSTLLCCYSSAKEFQEIQERLSSQMSNALVSDTFYAAERLLDIEGGQLSDREILLAQGHSRLHALPLLLFCLLQSDALRPKTGSFNPSIDARCAAGANMGNMSPGVLARCIAPRLELWLTGKNERKPAIESVNMTMDSIRMSVIDQTTDGGNCSEEFGSLVPLLLLDSPRQIMVQDCQEICNLKIQVTEEHLPDAMKQSIKDIVQSYRVSPPILITVGETQSLQKAHKAHLSDALVEDSEFKRQIFDDWCTDIAEVVNGELISLQTKT